MDLLGVRAVTDANTSSTAADPTQQVITLALRGAGTAGNGLSPAFSQRMGLNERLDMVEDFFLVNDVPSSRQAASAHLLMTEAVRRSFSRPGRHGIFPGRSSDVASWTPTTRMTSGSGGLTQAVDALTQRLEKAEAARDQPLDGVLRVRWLGPLSTRLPPATQKNTAVKLPEQRNQGSPSPGDDGTGSRTRIV
ncbi:hypothetical protein T4D_12339 [Trichinella pseudospiralis]|uniref:Uncharacterized protein n=1 Tax=Trichinella pseudospiralis TaxID=6337 RepID=A0A0V1F4E7_TRIPS|nr:hypothetical protein T4D_12339 [Trichinella pseudospiralis]